MEKRPAPHQESQPPTQLYYNTLTVVNSEHYQAWFKCVVLMRHTGFSVAVLDAWSHSLGSSSQKPAIYAQAS